MRTRSQLTTRLLVSALLLAVGPLKATTAYACEMMDTVVHDACCCDEAGPVRGNDSYEPAGGDAMQAVSEPCCDHSIAIGVTGEAPTAASASKPASKTPLTWFDIDLPDAGLVDSMAEPPFAACLDSSVATADETYARASDARLWLTTRRLRI